LPKIDNITTKLTTSLVIAILVINAVISAIPISLKAYSAAGSSGSSGASGTGGTTTVPAGTMPACTGGSGIGAGSLVL
jgi:hypothetical protein